MRYLLLFSILQFSILRSQTVIQIYDNGKLLYNYHTTQGRFNGKYTSYHSNGKKKAKGTFRDNYRIGTWKTWDSLGKLAAKRDYTDPFSFNQVFPKLPEQVNPATHKITYNSDSTIEYSNLREEDIILTKRIWRMLEPSKNELLFKTFTLFEFLNEHIQSKTLQAFAPSGDSFTVPIENLQNITTYSLVGFKIKEDWFFDADKNVSETRIIGICPVVKVDNKEQELYWVYYPNIRKLLAKKNVKRMNLPSYIKTMDDVFFYRLFYGQIYKESNVYDREIKDYVGDELKAKLIAQEIELKMIEDEHELWAKYYKN